MGLPALTVRPAKRPGFRNHARRMASIPRQERAPGLLPTIDTTIAERIHPRGADAQEALRRVLSGAAAGAQPEMKSPPNAGQPIGAPFDERVIGKKVF